MPYRLLSQIEAAIAPLGWLGVDEIDASSAAVLWAASGVEESGAIDKAKSDGWWRIKVTVDAVFGVKTSVWRGQIPADFDGSTTVVAGTEFFRPFNVLDVLSGKVEAHVVPNDRGSS